MQPGRARKPTPERSGSAVAKSVDGKRLYVADEDSAVIVVLDVTGEVPRALHRIERPGCGDEPASACVGDAVSLLAQDGYVLAAVRDPGLVVVLEEHAERGLVEVASVAVAPDAWGLGLSLDERTLLVTSSASRTLTSIDVPTLRVSWTRALAAEPRGVVLPPSGDVAFVSHLRGPSLTRVTRLSSKAPEVEPVELALDVPPVPSPAGDLFQGGPDPTGGGAPRSREVGHPGRAYAPVLTPDGARLFLPRHLGVGVASAVVDVLDVRAGVATPRAPLAAFRGARAAFTNPRDAKLLLGTGRLLVASEGTDELIALSASAAAPAAMPVRRYDLGGLRRTEPATSRCGAPSGLAVSDDEKRAFVLCRSTTSLAVVKLDAPPAPHGQTEGAVVSLGPLPFQGEVQVGRQLFYDARDAHMSEHAACATCHADGRWDGHVWTHVMGSWADALAERPHNQPDDGDRDVPVKSRVLAGRVREGGFVGMHAEAKDLEQHVLFGFKRHWGGRDLAGEIPRAKALVAFVTKGLKGPAPERRALTELEKTGRELFTSEACVGCHTPETRYTNGRVEPLVALPARPGFDVHQKAHELRVPSLVHVGEAGPWFHDGSAETLEGALDQHYGRLHRSAPDANKRAALVAFLRTLGAVDERSPPRPRTGEPRVRAAFDLRGEVRPKQPAALTGAKLVAGVPRERTPRPTDDAWKKAEPLPLESGFEGCKAWRIAEWARVRCPLEDRFDAGQSLMPSDDVDARLTSDGHDLSITLAMRPGDRRMLAVGHTVAYGKYGNWEAEGLALSEVWEPDAPGPSLAVLALPKPQRIGLAALIRWSNGPGL
jgi:DNA-binding beta-propeller fold protein YncE